MNHQLNQISKTLISFKTHKKSGLKSARKWLIAWAKQNQLVTLTWPGLNSFLIQTNPRIKKHFCFVAHLDVIPAPNWSQAFYPIIKQQKLFGRGAIDDKGPMACCLTALLAAKKIPCNTSCLIITDEETENREINFILADKTFNPNFCLVADGGENQKFDIGQKGNLWLSISVETLGGHAAFAEFGNNAANILTQFIASLQTIGQKLPAQKPFSPAFINISKFAANTEPLNMPQKAIAQIQISFPPPQTAAFWLKKIKHNQKVKIKIDWQSSPHILTAKKWLKLIKNTLPGANFITAGAPNLTHDLLLHKIPAISHCPTRKYLAHCDNESINLADLIFGKRFYLSLVKKFSKMR